MVLEHMAWKVLVHDVSSSGFGSGVLWTCPGDAGVGHALNQYCWEMGGEVGSRSWAGEVLHWMGKHGINSVFCGRSPMDRRAW